MFVFLEQKEQLTTFPFTCALQKDGAVEGVLLLFIARYCYWRCRGGLAEKQK